MLKSISFAEFQSGIAPLWRATDPTTIPIYNNPYGIIQYSPAEQIRQIIFRPAVWMEDGQPAAYTSIYNISHRCLRIRGIYVLPQFRHRGIGHQIWRAAAELFPSVFHRVVGFWRESSQDRFIRHSHMSIVPGTDWIWSDFSQVQMRMLYWDRPNPTGDAQTFIDQNIADWGLGGTNNLNQTFTEPEWLVYQREHAGDYPDLKIDLNFA